LACSGRDQLAWSLLNDEWVSHPTWASEDAGFLTHKKNSFEEMLHKSEEERHEYQVQIDAITRTIAVLDPLEARIDEMSAEERAQLKLGPNLGGESPSVYQKVIKKVYGRDALPEIYRALQEYPSVAVPVVLARLKQKSEEWRRLQREWNRTWRDVDAKNFYKALDHQGITFKNNDKKNIIAKYFMQDIETIKANQLARREAEGARPFMSLGYQLEYDLNDMEVLSDSLKLISSFLDHSASQYSASERRGIDQFLRSLVPTLYSFSTQEFNAACAPVPPAAIDDEDMDDGEDQPEEGTKSRRTGRRSAPGTESAGVPAGDLRKRLLKTVQEGPANRASAINTKQSNSNSPGTTSPADRSNHTTRGNVAVSDDEPRAAPSSTSGRSIADESWIHGIPLIAEERGGSASGVGETLAKKRPFFAGTTFYTLLRLLQVSQRYGVQLMRAARRNMLILAQANIDRRRGCLLAVVFSPAAM
jgi:paired amphipathic helix protein Sin3a